MTSLNLQRPTNKTMTPIREDITIPVYSDMPAPPKMHSVHIEPVEVRLPSTPQREPSPEGQVVCKLAFDHPEQSDSTGPDLTEEPLTVSPEDSSTSIHPEELETNLLRKNSALETLDQLKALEQQKGQQQQGQATPPVPARDPLRNAPKKGWVAKLLSKLTCTHKDAANKSSKPAKPVKLARSLLSSWPDLSCLEDQADRLSQRAAARVPAVLLLVL
ncbi:hypothetical protein D6D01_01303 [Aureobasidium pullulans]|uniref:Uncharacterized protein n=1 Tax=Aureobasidium pullulans TaxID=5580 RepID=A0A4S9LZE4_AURPU|nr:hypothetical protein D6D01_01303 [Aureobasidium pullulans]